jgi:tetratricopeptide (TPR) repeat protein
MTARFHVPCILALIAMLARAGVARADELRNIKAGALLPTYSLPTAGGSTVDSAAMKDNVVVLVYLSADQRSSELAAADSSTVLQALKGEPVKLVHVIVDVDARAYFDRFRAEHRIDVPLAIDAERSLYHELGLIVVPTTIISDKQGRLAHVIALRGPDYPKLLEAYIRHSLGKLSDGQLRESLKTTTPAEDPNKTIAAAHRAAAKRFREKGRLDAARAELLQAREEEPQDREVLLDLADIDLANNALDEADRSIAEVLAAQPDHRRAKQLKGISLYRHGKLDEAEKILLEALSLNPEPVRVHYFLGRIYEAKGDTAKALEHYREALQKTLHEDGSEPIATPAAGK